MNTDIPDARVVQGVTATITATTIDYLGEAAAATGTVTVAVTDSAGDAVATGAVNSGADPVHTATIAGTLITAPDMLTAVWSDDGNAFATHNIEVVGGVYCTVAELRSETALADDTKHPTADLQDDRFEVETQVEDACRRAFVPRFRTDIVQADGTDLLMLPYPDLRSVVWANYWTGTVWAAVSGTLSYVHENPQGWAVLRDNTWPSGPIQIGYRHGWDRPPADLKKACIKAIANHRHTDEMGMHNRATSMQVDGGTIQMATPGVRDWVTADPFVDEAINRYKWKAPQAG